MLYLSFFYLKNNKMYIYPKALVVYSDQFLPMSTILVIYYLYNYSNYIYSLFGLMKKNYIFQKKNYFILYKIFLYYIIL